MSGSCNKEGRNRKSACMTRYNTTNRASINKTKKVKRHSLAVMMKKNFPPKIERGTARKIKRAHLKGGHHA